MRTMTKLSIALLAGLAFAAGFACGRAAYSFQLSSRKRTCSARSSSINVMLDVIRDEMNPSIISNGADLVALLRERHISPKIECPSGGDYILDDKSGRVMCSYHNGSGVGGFVLHGTWVSQPKNKSMEK